MDVEMPDDLQNSEGFENEISMLEVVSFTLRRRRLILISAFGGILLAVASISLASLQYTATASFTPQGGGDRGSSSVSALSGLAQQFGVSIPRSSDATRSLQFYQDLITSRGIVDQLIESDIEVRDENTGELISLYAYFDISGETNEELTTRTREHLLDENVIVTGFGMETGVITVSARTNDPELSAVILERLLDLVSEFDLETRQSQASAERQFAEERLVQLQQELVTEENSLKAFLVENRQFSNSPQLNFEHDRLQRQVRMRQELVTALAQAYEQARIDEVRNTPVITVIDQPEPPAFPDARRRLVKLLMGFFFGTMAGFGIAFIREYGERTRTKDSRGYRELQELLTDAKKDPLSLGRHR